MRIYLRHTDTSSQAAGFGNPSRREGFVPSRKPAILADRESGSQLCSWQRIRKQDRGTTAQCRASREKKKYSARQWADRAQRTSVAWCYNNPHYDDCDGCAASGTAWCCSIASTVPWWVHLDSQGHIRIAQLSVPQRGPLWQPRPWGNHPGIIRRT